MERKGEELERSVLDLSLNLRANRGRTTCISLFSSFQNSCARILNLDRHHSIDETYLIEVTYLPLPYFLTNPICFAIA
jgi:hypothetical protein